MEKRLSGLLVVLSVLISFSSMVFANEQQKTLEKKQELFNVTLSQDELQEITFKTIDEVKFKAIEVQVANKSQLVNILNLNGTMFMNYSDIVNILEMERAWYGPYTNAPMYTFIFENKGKTVQFWEFQSYYEKSDNIYFRNEMQEKVFRSWGEDNRKLGFYLPLGTIINELGYELAIDNKLEETGKVSISVFK